MMLTLSEKINNLGQGGSTIVNINKSQFGKIKIQLQEVNIIKNFDSIVAPMFEMMLKKQYENITMAKLRDSLLPKLMSGEIDVSNIKI